LAVYTPPVQFSLKVFIAKKIYIHVRFNQNDKNISNLMENLYCGMLYICNIRAPLRNSILASDVQTMYSEPQRAL
jgi:hypothetical protein